MKRARIAVSVASGIIVVAALVFLLVPWGKSQHEAETQDALPFTLSLEEMSYAKDAEPPELQSYRLAVLPTGHWLVLGGRRNRGLHTFNPPPSNNFMGPNHFLSAIDPKKGLIAEFDLMNLPDELAYPLASTNQQAHYDQKQDFWYIAGGYGAGGKDEFVTFPTLIRLRATKVFEIITGAGTDDEKAQALTQTIESTEDPYFAVTGGELLKLGNRFFLVFGQKYTGFYTPFRADSFQKYTEQIGVFTLKPNSFQILSKGSLTSNDSDRPFHRRDGNVVETVDPKTGNHRISAFGGVFPPGVIAGYTEPIHIDTSGYAVDRNVSQRLSQYECPVLVVYDQKLEAVYQTFFGGISHYFYHQTAAQKKVYEEVAQQGRNDGLPFIADVSTLVLKGDGSSKQWILPEPMPEVPNANSNGKNAPTKTNLIGASMAFITHIDAIKQGYSDDSGIVSLHKVPSGRKVQVGWIYGGIRADYPLPLIPGTGTAATSAVFRVYLERKPSAAIPATEATEATASPGFVH